MKLMPDMNDGRKRLQSMIRPYESPQHAVVAFQLLAKLNGSPCAVEDAAPLELQANKHKGTAILP